MQPTDPTYRAAEAPPAPPVGSNAPPTAPPMQPGATTPTPSGPTPPPEGTVAQAPEPSPAATPARDAVSPAPSPAPGGGETLGLTGYIVEIRELGHRFGDVVAVDNISLAVPAGAILGIIGPSGSGKTTTIRTITGGLIPERGDVRVMGEEPRRFHRRTREKIGYMPQSFVLYPDLTARENVDFVAALFGLLGRDRRKRVDGVLRLVELDSARDRRASQLSGGMQRRLALACALVHQPQLLVLDEPTAGIDPLLRQRVWDELRRLRDEGVTLIVTTQYVTEAEYCDAVALISTGQLVGFAPPDELRRQALGGEVIEIVTTRAFDAKSVPALEGVVEIRQVGPREILVIAENAGRAGPQVADAIDAAGGDVEYSREYRPTFDEVFTTLVTRHLERQPGPAASDAATA